jgi:hypothetical protein
MEQRRFSETHRNLSRKNSKIIPVVSQIMFILGAFILVLGLIYMMINLEKSDSIIVIWISLMFTGVALVIMGILIKGKKEDTKDKNIHIHRHL